MSRTFAHGAPRVSAALGDQLVRELGEKMEVQAYTRPEAQLSTRQLESH